MAPTCSAVSRIAPSRPELGEDRRAELADERPDVAELAPQELAQEAELGRGEGRVPAEHPLHDLHVEDGVGEGLGRPVVDLSGQPRPLRLLGLEDPHLDVGRAHAPRRVADERGVVAAQEEPGALEALERQVQAGQRRLLRPDARASDCLIAAQRPDPRVLRPRLRGGRRVALPDGVAGRGPGLRPAIRRRELVAQLTPRGHLLEVALAEPFPDGAECVRAVGHGLLGLGQEALQPAVARVALRGVVHPGRVYGRVRVRRGTAVSLTGR